MERIQVHLLTYCTLIPTIVHAGTMSRLTGTFEHLPFPIINQNALCRVQVVAGLQHV